MTGEEYPIATLYDMARIPAEAVPRFIAELPSILAEVRHVQGVAAAFDLMFDGAFKMNLEDAGKPTWKDDDLGVGVTRVTMPNGDVIRRERNLRPTSEEAGA